MVKCVISDAENVCLMEPVFEAEIKAATFQLGKDKAPGPNGFSGVFFQSSWEEICKDVVLMVKNFFELGCSLDLVNVTDIVLVPKVDRPEWVSQFRPISLCNFVYKIISKVIVNRMKGILPRIVSEQQRAFVPGRLIQDNVIVAHEA